LLLVVFFFFLMIRRPPRSTPLYSSAASDVYKRQIRRPWGVRGAPRGGWWCLSLIHISEPTRLRRISYAVFCLKKKKKKKRTSQTNHNKKYKKNQTHNTNK